MAAAYFVGMVSLFAASAHFLFREKVLWGALLTIWGIGSVGFGLAMAWYIWRRQEADYRFTLEPQAREDRSGSPSYSPEQP